VIAAVSSSFMNDFRSPLSKICSSANKKRLVAVLTYHVLPGKIMAADAATTNAETVNGKKLPIKVDAGKVKAERRMS
jgi:uncharacterized surface protein with fasciclin (FAS1) repeats